jgi:hypothetical protein
MKKPSRMKTPKFTPKFVQITSTTGAPSESADVLYALDASGDVWMMIVCYNRPRKWEMLPRRDDDESTE